MQENYNNGNEGNKRNEYNLNNGFNENDYLDTRLKPGEKIKTKVIRLLPIEAGSNKFRAEVDVHKLKVDKEISQTGFKTFHCLNDKNNKRHSENVKCPLCAKSEELYAESQKYPRGSEQNKTFWKESKVYEPKKMDILRCIDRDDEAYGPKFCRFGNYGDGSGVFEMLQVLYKNRDEAAKRAGKPGYNMFNVYDGKDIMITIQSKPGINGAPDKTSYTIDIADDKTPLSTSQEQMNKWINDPKKWTDVYSCKSYDYLEVVASGKVPVYSKLLGRYVDKDKKEELEDNLQNGVTPVMAPKADASSDLPF